MYLYAVEDTLVTNSHCVYDKLLHLLQSFPHATFKAL